jgi:hypothetical protein
LRVPRPSSEAYVYCLKRLAALGVPVADSPEEEARRGRMPRLRVSIGGRTVPVSPLGAERSTEPHWYEVNYGIEFRDEVVYKRDPRVERYMPILLAS